MEPLFDKTENRFSEIDFVVMWVDGDDPDWQAEKAKYAGRTDDRNAANRYRDASYFRYWFRAVEQYAPWVRKIHFITWGHLPAFLNTDHPKLNIVNHKDFIPQKYLPTFNSVAIEMNIHRIPDLSEQFVFFNDDIFLLRQFSETDFFIDGVPCLYATEKPMPVNRDAETWVHIAVNDICIINKHFCKSHVIKKNRSKFFNIHYRWQENLRNYVLYKLYPDYFLGFNIFHVPSPIRKSTLSLLWDEEPELLDNTCSHRFRDREDVNQWLTIWWQIASGKFVPRKPDFVSVSIEKHNIDRICAEIENQAHHSLCLHDTNPDLQLAYFNERIAASFQTILPNPSSFEKRSTQTG